MSLDALKEDIHSKGSQLLTRDKSGKGYICPICGSGSGNKGTGITTKDGIHYTCWTGCFKSEDIIGIIGMKNGLTDFTDQIKATADELGIDYRTYFDSEQKPYKKQPRGAAMKKTKEQETNTGEVKTDYNSFFLQANKDLEKTTYHRGISIETLNRFNVGYVENWRHPKASDKVPTSPRLIIPTSKYTYLARDTRPKDKIPANAQAYTKQKVGGTPLFNIEGLYDKSGLPACVVVEGELDCMSVIDLGYFSSIGLGMVGNKQRFIEVVKEKRPTIPLILGLDNDDAGRKATAYLQEELNKLFIPYVVFNWEGVEGGKDFNELLNLDREKLTELLCEASRQAMEKIDEAAAAQQQEKEKALEEIRKESVANYIDTFIEEIKASENSKCYKTGFDNLDRLLDGGLYAGLYIVGAISSLGKTTFCLQVADQIAAAGDDVLIFSLEMARSELMAKSVSRYSYILSHDNKQAKTTRGILTGSRYKDYSNAEKELINNSLQEYSKAAQHIYISEGVGNIGVMQIREKVIRHIETTGKAPVVLIDYLQIMAPYDIKMTDKQNTDKAVTELKRISRDYNIPVIGISSFNRDNYTSPVNNASFKESGSIEYSSDILIGLQFAGMDYRGDESDKDRTKRIRQLYDTQTAAGRNGEAQNIQLKVLKSRNGGRDGINFKFYPFFNYFDETMEAEEIEASKIDNPFEDF